jgi:hypothetical protein
MLKIGWMEIPSLIENGVSQANFGYLVGVSSFGDELSTWKLVVVGLIDTAVPLGLAGPTPFAPSTCVPSCKHPSQKFCRGGYDRTSRFGRITKNLQNCFSMSCLLTNAMVKSNLKFKYA